MASNNQLLGHGDASEEIIEETEKNSMKLWRHDCSEGREFPPEMIKMMKYKGWKEFVVAPPEVVEEEPETEEDTGSLLDAFSESVEPSIIDHSDEIEKE